MVGTGFAVSPVISPVVTMPEYGVTVFGTWQNIELFTTIIIFFVFFFVVLV